MAATPPNDATPFEQDQAVAEELLEFPDNRLLIDLCGEYDRNLTDVEIRTNVQILRRGNQLVVIGDEDARAEAIEVLQSLYQRLEQGKSVEAGDIDREMRMGGSDAGTGIRSGDQMELIRSDRVEIKTRKKRLSRAPRRKRPMSNRCLITNWRLALDLLARAKPIWLWPWA